MPFVTKLFKNRLNVAIKLANIKNDSTILDVGCSRGYLLKLIYEQNTSCKLYGIDISELPVKYPWDPHCELKVGDVRDIPFKDETFSILFVADVLEHVDELDIALKEIHRILKPNGVAILTGPTESWFYKLCRLIWLGRTNAGYHLYTIYDIEKKFENNSFKLLERKSLPGFPLPQLFRISMYQKLS